MSDHYAKFVAAMLSDVPRTSLRYRLVAFRGSYHYMRHHGFGVLDSLRSNLYLLRGIPE